MWEQLPPNTIMTMSPDSHLSLFQFAFPQYERPEGPKDPKGPKGPKCPKSEEEEVKSTISAELVHAAWASTLKRSSICKTVWKAIHMTPSTGRAQVIKYGQSHVTKAELQLVRLLAEFEEHICILKLVVQIQRRKKKNAKGGGGGGSHAMKIILGNICKTLIPVIVSITSVMGEVVSPSNPNASHKRGICALWGQLATLLREIKTVKRQGRKKKQEFE